MCLAFVSTYFFIYLFFFSRQTTSDLGFGETALWIQSAYKICI